MSVLTGVKNIIFDLGNVLIDIDPSLTYNGFASLSNTYDAEQTKEIIVQKQIMHNYEKGLMTDADFRNEIRTTIDLRKDTSDQQIDEAFCALLLTVEKERIDLVHSLSAHYQLFVLSNTSAIHMRLFPKIVERCIGHADIWAYFKKVYFSYEIQKMKPEAAIYEQVLSEQNLEPYETLFLDDLEANVKAAAELGIKTIQVIKPHTIIDYLV